LPAGHKHRAVVVVLFTYDSRAHRPQLNIMIALPKRLQLLGHHVQNAIEHLALGPQVSNLFHIAFH
jgi:hypothetical protein